MLCNINIEKQKLNTSLISAGAMESDGTIIDSKAAYEVIEAIEKGYRESMVRNIPLATIIEGKLLINDKSYEELAKMEFPLKDTVLTAIKNKQYKETPIISVSNIPNSFIKIDGKLRINLRKIKEDFLNQAWSKPVLKGDIFVAGKDKYTYRDIYDYIVDIFEGNTQNEVEVDKNIFLSKLPAGLSNVFDTRGKIILKKIDNTVNGKVVEGYYKDGNIYINKDIANKELVYLHELIHKNFSKLSAKDKKEIQVYYDYAIKNSKNKELYGYSSLEEFIAGLFNNKALIKDLKSIKPLNSNRPNVFNEILDYILQTLGLKKEDSLYEEVFNKLSESLGVELEVEVEDNNNASPQNKPNDTSESIYSQLGNKTQSENVIIDEVNGRKPAVESKPKYYEGNIKLESNTVFVFGSNPEGRHGAGAAKVAKDKFGAKYGQGEGLQGNSYAIPTKNIRNVVEPKNTINVYWGQAESKDSTKILSNLAPRKFTWEGREYGSVEHAYQTLKSGTFDQTTYNAYLKNSNQKLSTFTNHSGGAVGADTEWDVIGKEFGMVNNKHYYFEGFNTPNGNTAIPIKLKNEADSKLKAANKTLDRKFPTSKEYVNNLLRRNWWQVKNSDAVFAISTITDNKVNGGTGWAVHMAIAENKPVYVFDQNVEEWFTWSNGSFIKTETPILTKNFAGIGTRKINQAGKQAIRDVYSNTLNDGIHNAYGKKIRGKGTVAEMKAADSLGLMKKLVVESFIQNPNSEAAKKLLQYENFTHNTNEIIDQAFLEGLKIAQKELSTVGSKSIKPEQIIQSIKQMYETAIANPTKTFAVAYRNAPNERTLNGYTGQEMIEMFNKAGEIPSNVIFSKEWVDTGKINQSSKPIVAYRTQGNNFLKALQEDNAIGNPWGPYGQFKTANDSTAVKEFIAWMIGEKHTDKLQDYRQAIINKISELKGKTILYYKDIKRPSHATALDYLINKYDWGQLSTQSTLQVESQSSNPIVAYKTQGNNIQETQEAKEPTLKELVLNKLKSLYPEVEDTKYSLSEDNSQERQYQKSTQIKAEVEELFESNPELANQVYEALGFDKQINEIADTKKVDEFIKKYKEAIPNIKDGKTLISHLQTVSDRNTGTTKQFADLIIKLSKLNKGLETLLNNPNLYAKPNGVGDEGAFHWSLFNNLSVNKIVLELDHFKTNTYDDVFLHELIHNLTTQFIVKDSDLFNQSFYNKVKELYSIFDNYLESNRKVNEPLLKSTKEDVNNLKEVLRYFTQLPSDAIQQELIFGKIGSVSTIKGAKLDFKSLENKSKQDVLKEIEAIISFKESRIKEIKKGDKDYYYFNSKTFKQENVLSEFLATFINDTNFREQLKNIEYKNNKSLFQKIIDLFSEFLGLTKNDSLYNEFVLTLTNFINNNDYSSIAKQTVKTAYQNRIDLLERQKQQAQQLYSQYLDTIFPDSKVKDIVYHGTNAKFDRFDKKYLSKYDVGYYGKGFYFSTKPNKSYSDKTYHKQNEDGVILPVILNLPNPNYKASNDFSDTGKDIIGSKGVIVIDENLDNELTERTRTPEEFVNALLKLGKYDIDQIVVYEPEQIHILGSKQDIEGFKEFTQEKQLPNREEIITSLLADNSFAVEINTAKKQPDKDNTTDGFILNNKYYRRGYSSDGSQIFEVANIIDVENFQMWEPDTFTEPQEITKEKYLKAREQTSKNTQYYSNLTVPGGTNGSYREVNIESPLITLPKSHAQFNTEHTLMFSRIDDAQTYSEKDIEKLISLMENSGQLEIKCN